MSEAETTRTAPGDAITGQNKGKCLDKKRPPHSSKKRCPLCKKTLGESWSKPLCRNCMEGVARDQAAEQNLDLAASVRELTGTFQSFQTLFSGYQPPQPAPGSVQREDRPGPSNAPVWESGGPGVSNRDPEEPDSPASGSQESGAEGEGGSSRSSLYKLSLEQVDELVTFIHSTLGIQEEKRELSLHDQMYEGLAEPRNKVFPVHDTLLKAISRQWNDPQRKQALSKNLKRRFPFSEDETYPWNKSPKLDAAFSQVARKIDLVFEDSGILMDPMDKRMDALLKRVWDSTVGNLRPAMATSVVARNMEYWLSQLKTHIESDTSKEIILKLVPALQSGLAYIADASDEAVRMSARSSALSNAVRRALWLKTWQGDYASKVKLCALPFSGDLLFGPELEEVLNRTADKKKAFPVRKKPQQPRKNPFFRPQVAAGFLKAEGKKKAWKGKGRGRSGEGFRPPEQTHKKE